jgi:hypothetical protein
VISAGSLCSRDSLGVARMGIGVHVLARGSEAWPTSACVVLSASLSMTAASGSTQRWFKEKHAQMSLMRILCAWGG